jgi:hypothetical protein
MDCAESFGVDVVAAWLAVGAKYRQASLSVKCKSLLVFGALAGPALLDGDFGQTVGAPNQGEAVGLRHVK